MTASRRLRELPVFLIAGAALAGCGGGGGDAASAGAAGVVIPTGVRSEAASAGSDVSANNYASFGTRMGRFVLSVSGGAGVSGSTGSSAPVQSFGREQPSASGQASTSCQYGGTLAITATDADNNSRINAGDSIGIVATNCQLESSGEVANGALNLRLNAVELAGNNLTAFDANGTFTQFSIDNTGSLTGNVRIWLRLADSTGEKERVSFNGVQSVLAGETVIYNLDGVSLTSGNTETFSIDGAIGVLGETYKVVQTTPFTVLNGDVPTAGVIALSDAAGDTLRLTAKSTRLVDIDFIPAGASAPTLTLADQSWASFRTGQ